MKDGITSKVFQKRIKYFLMKLLHFLVVLLMFACAWVLFRYNGKLDFSATGFRYNYFVIIGYGVIEFFFLRTYNAYLLGYSRIRALVFAQFISQAFGAVIVYFIVSIAWNHFDSPLFFAVLLAPLLIWDALWSRFANRLYFRLNPPKKTILIYRNHLDRKRFGSISGKPSERLYKIEKELMYDGTFHELENQLEGYDAIFVAGINSRCRNGILKYCQEQSIPGFFLPHVGDVIMQQAQHIQAFDSPILLVGRKIINPEYVLIKRVFDFCASLLGLIVLSPILLVTALAIKLYDGGPAIYKQVRLTKDGREFKIWKFRSMRVDAEKDGVARLSTGDKDDRITPIGRIVRKCRLDELPQLWNILRGDMSIVGPRPERPEIAAQYYKTMPDFKLRLQVKAGLTGYAQIYGKYNTDPYEKIEFDLMYIKNMSVLTDLQLMFATFGILFLPESTEGVAQGATTAMDYGNAADSTENDAETVAK